MKTRSRFIPLGAALGITFTASVSVGLMWLFFWLYPSHPKIYWCIFSFLIAIIASLWWVLTDTASKLLEDSDRNKNEVERVKQEATEELGRLNTAHRAAIAHKDTSIADAGAEARGLKKALEAKDAECEDRIRALRQQSDGGALAVELEPTKGQSETQFLVVTNRGEKQRFYAQCSLLNDFSHLQTTFNLGWDFGGRYVAMAPEESRKLAIARAWQHRASDLEYIALREEQGSGLKDTAQERWAIGQMPTVRYRLRIRVFGESTQNSRSEEFVVQPGKSTAIEMRKVDAITPESPTWPILSPLQVEAFECAKKLRDWIATITSLATPPLIAGEADEERERRIQKARADYRVRLKFEYEHSYRETVQSIYRRFAIQNIRDLWFETMMGGVGHEETVLNMANSLEALAIRQFAPEASKLIMNRLNPLIQTVQI